ncbi:TIGR03663 family protein [Haloparvum alkalitolerans]|uniref:flippase activity-associated protein Agl23 n=1 Tax=Haloparvum alkalitolerans TaxID=1042953 RepID=UPI003CEC5026
MSAPRPSELPAPLDRLSDDGRTLLALAGVTVAALLLRLYELGGRVFHWDEGRVGYWTLRYAASGQLEYRPIIHGPFLRIVNAGVFEVLPATDATARLVVALVGGLLPLSAWLFREHLDRGELLALGGLLATTPLLVYYSRFMRNDVLVGGFAFVALGFVVRALDTRRVGYLYPASVLLAISLATKANTLLYVLCFLGAGTLVADHRLVRRVRGGEDLSTALRAWGSRGLEELRAAAGDRRPAAFLVGHALGLGLAFLAVTVFFYAPRPDLYQAFGAPGMWGGVLSEATVGSARKLSDLWLSGSMQDNPYLQYVGHEAETLIHTAGVLLALAPVGVAADWYGRGSREGAADAGADAGGGEIRVPTGRNRAFVAFATYWALASFVGYPAATDINAPWSAVHIVLPLSIPAAVGLTYLVREAASAVATADRETAALAAVLLLVVGAGLVGPNVTYWNSANPDHTEMVQWAQPHNDARSTIEDVEAVARAHEGGTDVLFVGIELPSREDTFYVADESAADQGGAPGGWYDRLPLPWYYERAGAEVDSLPPDADYDEALADAPPVVIAHEDDRETVAANLDGYRATAHELRLWNFEVVFFVEEDALETAREGGAGGA